VRKGKRAGKKGNRKKRRGDKESPRVLLPQILKPPLHFPKISPPAMQKGKFGRVCHQPSLNFLHLNTSFSSRLPAAHITLLWPTPTHDKAAAMWKSAIAVDAPRKASQIRKPEEIL
jgi:hypothetical protein